MLDRMQHQIHMILAHVMFVFVYSHNYLALSLCLCLSVKACNKRSGAQITSDTPRSVVSVIRHEISLHYFGMLWCCYKAICRNNTGQFQLSKYRMRVRSQHRFLSSVSLDLIYSEMDTDQAYKNIMIYVFLRLHEINLPGCRRFCF